MTAVAVVMGRAGSKGVPGKNMLAIAGRPCAAWTIEAALRAQHVERVLVSSDCPRLLALGEQMGAEPAPRRAEDASDVARVDVALRHALEDWAAGDANCAHVVMLYANVPVRPAGLIDRAVESLVTSGCDSVQSYARVGKHHPWWQTRLEENGRVLAWEGSTLFGGVYRRQELPPSYVPDGGVLALKRRALYEPVNEGPHGFLGADHRGIATEEGDVVDIDAQVDVLVAEAKLKGMGQT